MSVNRVSRAVLALLVLLVTIGGSANAQVAGEIRGRVTNAETARPVANTRIEISGRTESVRTSTDGSYIIRGLEPSSYTVTARAVGFAAATYEVEMRNGRISLLDFSLNPKIILLSDVQVSATRDTSAVNSTVIERTTIEQSGRRDLGELLQTAPGVVVTQAGGPGQSSHVSIRGSSSNQVLVLVDGVPLNSAISGGADLSRVALESVEKVTVRTGAQSARYGPRAMAGVIEIETRKPKREVSSFLKTGALGERDAAVSMGTSTPLRTASFGASLAADYRTVEGEFSYDLPALRGGGRATRINSDATSKQLLAGFSLEGAGTSASLRANWQNIDRGLAGTIIQPSTTGRQGHSRLSGGGSAQGNAKRIAWTLAADVTREAGTFVDPSPPFGQAFNDTVIATSVTASSSAAVVTGAFSNSIGAEMRSLDISSTMLAPGAPHWQQLLGAWGNTRFSHSTVSKMTVDAELSARVDRNSLSQDVTLSPRSLLRLSRGVLATSVSLGSGYAPPALSDQFFHEGVQARANPALRPERTRRDIEGRLTLRETAVSVLNVSGEAAAYRSNIDGMILWFPDFRFIWSPNNFDVRRSGWELNGRVAMPKTKLELSGTLNRNDVAYTGTVLSGQVAYRPRNTGNFNVAYARRAFRIDVSNRYVGTRRTIAGSGLNSLTPYRMSDARVSSSFTRHSWTFNPAVGVENLFNRAAAMLVDYPFPPRTWSVSVRVRRSSQSP